MNVPALLLVHYGSAAATAAALAGAVPQLPAGAPVLVLDNRGDLGDGPMWRFDPALPPARLLVPGRNLGFAAGMNRLIEAALAVAAVQSVLLLNDDTLPGAVLVAGLLAAQAEAPADAGMVAARLMAADDPSRIDSLGITLYRSGLASNRKRLDERLLGPTGGCMLLSRRLLGELYTAHGEYFDESFFCYAEDTDLVMRARWLGFGVAYADHAVALHKGSASSGGPDNEFVLYHGIRNSLWALAKNAPALWLLAHLPWIVLAHGGIWLRNLRKGRWRTLLRLYRDALVGLPAVLRKRIRVRRSRRVPASAWWRWVEPRLYERGYLRIAWRDLWRRAKR
ncbi:MAG: glycosyltransferase family 2 protein [Xanthomonadales bacterium]|nr:glycosyltransferase family 2 protein [Xanthomonadales bacterium]